MSQFETLHFNTSREQQSYLKTEYKKRASYINLGDKERNIDQLVIQVKQNNFLDQKT